MTAKRAALQERIAQMTDGQLAAARPLAMRQARQANGTDDAPACRLLVLELDAEWMRRREEVVSRSVCRCGEKIEQINPHYEDADANELYWRHTDAVTRCRATPAA